jgi:hypothetical protein
MTNQNYVNKQMIQFIESHAVDGESTLNTYPKVLPNGRSLIILKCMTCKYYSYKGTTKINNTDQVFFEWVPKQKCTSCSKTERYLKKHPDKPDVIDNETDEEFLLKYGMTKEENWHNMHNMN